mgnify:CR=1 FL=1
MLEQLQRRLEGHSGNVGSHTRRFDYMNRATDAGGEHLCFPIIVLIYLDDILQQDQPIFADVIQTTEKGTDKTLAPALAARIAWAAEKQEP